MTEIIALTAITCATLFAIALSSAAKRGDQIATESLILSVIDEYKLSAIRCEDGWRVGRLIEYYTEPEKFPHELRGYLEECAVAPSLQGTIEQWLKQYG